MYWFGSGFANTDCGHKSIAKSQSIYTYLSIFIIYNLIMLKSFIATVLSVLLVSSVATFAYCPPCPTGPWWSAYVAIPAPIPGATVTTSNGTGSTVTTKKVKKTKVIGTAVFWFNDLKTYTVNTRNPVKYAVMCCGDNQPT